MASPAEIVRAMLIEAGLVIYPDVVQQPGDGTTQCVVNVVPDQPDQLLLLKDVGGRQFGRLMDGPTLKHYAVKMNMRSLDDAEGYDVIQSIYLYIDDADYPKHVVSRGMECHIASVYNTSEITSLGEQEGTRRRLWALDIMVALQAVEYTSLEV